MSARFLTHFNSNASQRNFPDATHIFDGLNAFPTHIAHLCLGAFIQPPTPWNTGGGAQGSLYDTALQWLTEDRAHRRQLELNGRKTRGARRNTVRNSPWHYVTRLAGHSFPLLHSRVRRATRRPSTRSTCAVPYLIEHDWLTETVRYDYSH